MPGTWRWSARPRRRAERVVATIFVNPKQFAPSEDLGAYPRREAADLDMLRAAGVDLAFVPGGEEIYPPGFATLVRVAGLTEGLCGAHRAGHFDGVATVVAKLLIQSMPDVALFRREGLPAAAGDPPDGARPRPAGRIDGVATVREADGLALSSRNAYLTPAERQVAPELARVLRGIAAALASGPTAVAQEIEHGRAALTQAGFGVEYLEIRDAESLAP